MRQQVTVFSVDGTVTRVSYKRPTACHGDCTNCAGGCGAMAAQETLIVEAENLIGAKPGDRVIIEGETAKAVKAVFLVYVLPLLLFFLGYFLCGSFGIPAGIFGFILGMAAAVAVSRRQTKKGTAIRYRIVAFAEM